MSWQPIDTFPDELRGYAHRVDLWAINPMMDEVSPMTGPHAVRFADCFWADRDTRCPRWVSSCGEETVEDSGWIVTHWMLPPPPPEAP